MVRYFNIVLGALLLLIFALVIAAIVIAATRPDGAGLWLFYVGLFLAIAIVVTLIVAAARFSYTRIQKRRARRRN
ncbi:hypothetical protein [Sicyoidochytrium minutum DNA virus]|nr:hypothetical protein [Sicyoidochytrium minutum DNA virus]BDC16758.1 hypothetical protein [Sicyoidochytrium minutum DNA virus]